MDEIEDVKRKLEELNDMILKNSFLNKEITQIILETTTLTTESK